MYNVTGKYFFNIRKFQIDRNICSGLLARDTHLKTGICPGVLRRMEMTPLLKATMSEQVEYDSIHK